MYLGVSWCERSVGSLCVHPDCLRNMSDGSNWSQIGVGGVDELGRSEWDQERKQGKAKGHSEHGKRHCKIAQV